MKLSDRIDGHLVQGHVDDTTEILTINQNLESHEIRLSCPQELIKFITKKGYCNARWSFPYSKFSCRSRIHCEYNSLYMEKHNFSA